MLSGRDFKPTVGRYESPVELASLFAGDNRALVLAAPLPAKPGVAKLVPVSPRADDPAFLPTPENLHSGDYPLQLPLRVAFRRESALALQSLLNLLYSDELASRLERAGVVPLPEAARRRQRAVWEKISVEK